MARTKVLVIVLFLALTENYTDCAVSLLGSKPGSDFCESAEYQGITLLQFVERCSPEAWGSFFVRKNVVNAIEIADKDIKKKEKEEIYALEQQGHKFLTYHTEPEMRLMFEAFNRVRPENVKVVILGQDPTPQKGKATGRAFSVENPRTVGSAMNVLLEVALEGWSVNLNNGDLSNWENQGVLLLNSALTIGLITYQDPKGKIITQQVSHLGYWCPFTKLLIEYISDHLPEPTVWILWGKVAQDFTVRRKFDSFIECFNPSRASKTDITLVPSIISRPKNYVLTGGHPSALGGAGGMNTFFAGNYFYCANEFLSKKRLGVIIDWGLVTGKSKQYEVGSILNPCPQFH